jgi:histidinol-phosphate aminotransferase
MSSVIVITGSSRGIGRELAIACAARGDRVVVHGRDQVRIDDVVAEIRAAGGDAIGIAADLATDPDALIAGALAAYGTIDVLVNNAATSAPRAPLWELADGEIERVVAANITAPMRCARAVLAWAVPQKHPVRIVNVSSGIVAAPRAHAAAYVATKAALDGLTRALAADVTAIDISGSVVITGIALGGHRTELVRELLPEDELARLPSAAAATARLLDAVHGPADAVHGRVLDERSPPPLDVDAVDLLAHPTGPSPRARAALAAAAQTAALERYPAPPAALRKVLAARFGMPLDGVVVGGGIGELLERVLAAAARPGDTVVANTPSWPLFPHLCRTHSLRWRAIPYRLDDGRADHDLPAVLAAVDRGVRVVYLTSPANPGGTAIDRTAFGTFVAAVPRHVTIVVDEAYIEYATRKTALDASAFVRWIDRPLVVLRTFSKIHGLAGLRVGYALASREPARALARAARPFQLVRGAEEAAIAALADVEHVRRTRDQIADARARLAADLDRRGIAHLASDAPFVLAATDAPGPRFFDGRYVMMRVWDESATTNR